VLSITNTVTTLILVITIKQFEDKAVYWWKFHKKNKMPKLCNY
jgi:hypothetical protein